MNNRLKSDWMMFVYTSGSSQMMAEAKADTTRAAYILFLICT